jgi:hypothetical protein
VITMQVTTDIVGEVLGPEGIIEGPPGVRIKVTQSYSIQRLIGGDELRYLKERWKRWKAC